MKERIRQFIATNFSYDIAKIENSTPLLESDIVDSTGVMELVFFVTDAFKVNINAGDLVPANFNTINGLSNLIQARMA